MDSAPAHSVDAVSQGEVETALFQATDFTVLIRKRADIGLVVFRNLAIDVSSKLRHK